MSNQQSSSLQQNPSSQPQQKSDQTCHLCDKYFKKTSHYNRHMRERHSESRDHVCPEQGCGKTFKRGSHLKRHMITHTNTKAFKCSYCIMRFGYKHHLDRHVKMVHLSEKIECVPCDLKFKKKKSYTKHLQSVHAHELGTLPKAQLSGKAENSAKGKDNGATRTGLEETNKVQENFLSQESESSEQGKQLYRCHYQSCMSAFLRLHDFKRHLSKLHNEDQHQ